MADSSRDKQQPVGSSPATSASVIGPSSVQELRRRWKPEKERLSGDSPNHPTLIRVHRAFSWLARVERITGADDLDLALICRWVAFNSLYGQWNAQTREPMSDRESWRRFLDRILALDNEQHVSQALIQHKKLVVALLDDEYLSSFFWQEPSSHRAGKAKRAKFEAQTWYLERRWVVLMDHLIERIYLMRCQLMHGAATFGGKLNRDSLRRSSIMLGHLVDCVLLTIVDNGADEDWGTMCYPPLRSGTRQTRQTQHEG